MATTGIVKKPFPYSTDGIYIEHLAEGRVFSFPDQHFIGLEKEGYVEKSGGEPENSIAQAERRDLATQEIDGRLAAASDQDLKDIIARSGTPISGNLVHADLISRAKAQLRREAEGRAPARGVDPNAGITEQPLAKPGEATPASAGAQVAQVDEAGRVNQFGDEAAQQGKGGDVTDDLKAVHRGGGSYAVMRGDQPVDLADSMTKEQATEFNALDAAAKAAFITANAK